MTALSHPSSGAPKAHLNQSEAATKLLNKIKASVHNFDSFDSFTFAVVTTASLSLRRQTADRITNDFLSHLTDCNFFLPLGDYFTFSRVKAVQIKRQFERLTEFVNAKPNSLVVVFIDEVHFGSTDRVDDDEEKASLMRRYLQGITKSNVVFIGVTATAYNLVNFYPDEEKGTYTIDSTSPLAPNCVQIAPPPEYCGFDTFKAYSHVIDGDVNADGIVWGESRCKSIAPTAVVKQTSPLQRHFFDDRGTFVPRVITESDIDRIPNFHKPLCFFTRELECQPQNISQQYADALEAFLDNGGEVKDKSNVFQQLLAQVVKSYDSRTGKIEWSGVLVVRFGAHKSASVSAMECVKQLHEIKTEFHLQDEVAVMLASKSKLLKEEKLPSSLLKHKAGEAFPTSVANIKHGIVVVVDMVAMGDTFPEYVRSYDVRDCFNMTTKGEDSSAFRKFQQIGRAFGYGRRPVLLLRQATLEFDSFVPQNVPCQIPTSNFFRQLAAESPTNTFALLSQPQMGKTGTMLEVLNMLYSSPQFKCRLRMYDDLGSQTQQELKEMAQASEQCQPSPSTNKEQLIRVLKEFLVSIILGQPDPNHRICPLCADRKCFFANNFFRHIYEIHAVETEISEVAYGRNEGAQDYQKAARDYLLDQSFTDLKKMVQIISKINKVNQAESEATSPTKDLGNSELAARAEIAAQIVPYATSVCPLCFKPPKTKAFVDLRHIIKANCTDALKKDPNAQAASANPHPSVVAAVESVRRWGGSNQTKVAQLLVSLYNSAELNHLLSEVQIKGPQFDGVRAKF
eukprot:PhM_4_TR18636/c0_g1_i4/m.80064